MKAFNTALLICVFTGIAIFGFAAVGHQVDGHRDCIASSAASAPCPESGSFSSAFFHISVLKSFSTAVVISSLAFILFLALSAFFADKEIIKNLSFPEFSFAFRLQARSERMPSVFKSAFTDWLAIYEKRSPDNFLASA